MEIALIETVKPGDNKDYNAGFGTTFDIKGSVLSYILRKLRGRLECFPTISYAYISAVFKKYGHSVKYYKNTLPDKFDVAILNGTIIRNKEDKDILRAIKTKGKTLVYGSFPSVCPEVYSNADTLIKGNFYSVFENIAKSSFVPEGIIENTASDDYDKLPFPDWSIFNYNKFSYAPILPGKPFFFMIRTSGCPYKCSYCPHTLTPLSEKRSISGLVSEMEYLKKKYYASRVHFKDACFDMSNDEIKEFKSLLDSRGIDIKWGIETRVDLLSKEKIDLYYSAGLRAIKIGVENPSKERLLNHKRIPPALEHTKKMIDYARKKGIRTNACYIIGFKDETKSDVKKTFTLAKYINSSYANFFILTPLPDTSYFKNSSIKIIDHRMEKRDNFNLVFKHENFTPKELKKLQRKALTGYYFRFKYLICRIIENFKSDI
jgi:radical SAM superfamily enzyme YgiQ (UPF0313 family)